MNTNFKLPPSGAISRAAHVGRNYLRMTASELKWRSRTPRAASVAFAVIAGSAELHLDLTSSASPNPTPSIPRLTRGAPSPLRISYSAKRRLIWQRCPQSAPQEISFGKGLKENRCWLSCRKKKKKKKLAALVVGLQGK